MWARAVLAPPGAWPQFEECDSRSLPVSSGGLERETMSGDFLLLERRPSAIWGSFLLRRAFRAVFSNPQLSRERRERVFVDSEFDLTSSVRPGHRLNRESRASRLDAYRGAVVEDSRRRLGGLCGQRDRRARLVEEADDAQLQLAMRALSVEPAAA